jgi:AraC-like DNA-binding protein
MSYDRIHIRAAITHLLITRQCLSLSQAAEELHIDRRTIEQALKPQGGFRVTKHRLLFARAIDLLCNPDLSVKQIAASCGYAAPRAFARFIVAQCGLRPTELKAFLLSRRTSP